MIKPVSPASLKIKASNCKVNLTYKAYLVNNNLEKVNETSPYKQPPTLRLVFQSKQPAGYAPATVFAPSRIETALSNRIMAFSAHLLFNK